MTVRRGFRAEAERIAVSVRSDLKLRPTDPLPLEDACSIRGIEVISAGDLVDPERLVELERIQAYSFSACTLEARGRKVIIYNPIRSEARRKSDIAHELSHLLLEHELTEIREVGGVFFRTCQADQEEEATNLAGALLLPRPLLLRAVRRGKDERAIARANGVTEEMARFRLNTTGVRRQVERARAKRA